MHDLAVAVKLAGTLFEESGVAWALVGGWAVSVHTQPRFTRDVDLAVAVENDAAAERVTAAFLKQGFRISALVEQDDRERLATVRLESRQGQGNSLLLDLLYASSGVEEEICRAALSLEILPGLTG